MWEAIEAGFCHGLLPFPCLHMHVHAHIHTQKRKQKVKRWLGIQTVTESLLNRQEAPGSNSGTEKGGGVCVNGNKPGFPIEMRTNEDDKETPGHLALVLWGFHT